MSDLGDFQRSTPRLELLKVLDNGNCHRDNLIAAVTLDSDFSEENVRHALEGLDKRGEVYIVDGEVRKTP